MAKSLRSKWRRKCRAVKRERYGQKELDRLQKTITNDPSNKPKDVDMQDISDVTTVVDKSQITKGKKDVKKKPITDEKLKVMETNERLFNQKTLRDQHGSYPVWVHPRKVHKSKKVKKQKSKKRLKK